MVGWLGLSIGIGILFIPLYLKFVGAASYDQLTGHQQTAALVVIQTLETFSTLGLIYWVTSKFGGPDTDTFKFSLNRPFEKRYGWLIWALIGMTLAVGSNLLITEVRNLVNSKASGYGTIDSVLEMIDLDPLSYVSLISVVGVMAPILEETVFRGFLLPSLMEWMPTSTAIAVSSILFGCAHFSVKDLPYLICISAVWGFMYVRSRNLATPMLLHSMWNSSTLTLLFVLKSLNIDLKNVMN